MKKILVFTVLICFMAAAHGQETFFPTKEGTVLVYKTFDKKSKETGSIRYTIEKVSISGNDMDISYLVESSDSRGASLYTDKITIQQRDGRLYMDMSNMVNKDAFQQDGEIPAELEITGNKMEIPVGIQPGQTLPDASVVMAMKMGFVSMKMAADITNRKVDAIEDVTVPAGTFKCYKLSGDVSATVMGMNVKTSNLDWYAKGIGLIRSESYDKSNKLQSFIQLTELRK